MKSKLLQFLKQDYKDKNPDLGTFYFINRTSCDCNNSPAAVFDTRLRADVNKTNSESEFDKDRTLLIFMLDSNLLSQYILF